MLIVVTIFAWQPFCNTSVQSTLRSIDFNFSVLQCIKKNGSSLEHLELSRSSLLRMDPLRFRNVLSSASRLTSLVVRNICSDAMLKLIGAHCSMLQYLVVANSKQVTDIGVESLCCQVTILGRDGGEVSD